MRKVWNDIRVVFTPAFILLVTGITALVALGQAKNNGIGGSIGTMMVNMFGGMVWSEEATAEEIANWFILYLPAGIGVLILLQQRIKKNLRLEGSRYGSSIAMIIKLLFNILMTLMVIYALETAVTMIVGLAAGFRKMTVFSTDADGFLQKSAVLPWYSLILCGMYILFLSLLSVCVYFISGNSAWFMAAYVGVPALSALAFSNPFSKKAGNPVNHLINCGMAKRFACEGTAMFSMSHGVFVLSIGILAMILLVIAVVMLIRPYDREFN